MAASAMDLTSKIRLRLEGIARKTTYEFEQPYMNLAHAFVDSLADGTGADQANQIYQDEATVLALSETSYDLNGVLADCFGGTITFARIKGILLLNTSATASVLQLGGGTGLDGTNAFDTWITANGADGSEGVLVGPGGVFLLYRPDATAYTTGAGTNILIVKEKSTLAASFQLSVIGVV